MRSAANPNTTRPTIDMNPVRPKIAATNSRGNPWSTAKATWWVTIVNTASGVHMYAKNSAQNARVRSAARTRTPPPLAATPAAREAGAARGALWTPIQTSGSSSASVPIPRNRYASRHPCVEMSHCASGPTVSTPTPHSGEREAHHGGLALCEPLRDERRARHPAHGSDAHRGEDARDEIEMPELRDPASQHGGQAERDGAPENQAPRAEAVHEGADDR
jgi:hypothetical protein